MTQIAAENEGAPPGGYRPKLSRKEASAVLGEYPDADLSAFDVEGGDVEALAVETATSSIDRILDRMGSK